MRTSINARYALRTPSGGLNVRRSGLAFRLALVKGEYAE